MRKLTVARKEFLFELDYPKNRLAKLAKLLLNRYNEKAAFITGYCCEMETKVITNKVYRKGLGIFNG